MKGLGVMVAAIIALLVHVGGCKKDSVGPQPPKNPREYTWAVDTLAYPGSLQTLMRSIWGPSNTDIYICGHNDQRFAKMYHWNGSGWTNVKLHVSEGGPFVSLASLSTVFGFLTQGVYAVGALGPDFNPFLIHFNGAQWREITVPDGRGLQSIWGRSPGEIWIGGMEGFLARYDGSHFTPESTPYTFDSAGMDIQVSQITGDASTAHLVLAVSPDSVFAPIFYFYERIGTQWQVADSSYELARIFIDPAGTAYRYGYDGVQRQQGSAWVSALSGLTVGRNGMAASSATNIFVVGFAGSTPAGRVYHYDGRDWFEYAQLRIDNVNFEAVWTDGMETFVIGTTSDYPMKTVVLRGK
jgi:hypothetical protein